MPLDMYAKWIDKATKRIADVSAIRQAWPFAVLNLPPKGVLRREDVDYDTDEYLTERPFVGSCPVNRRRRQSIAERSQTRIECYTSGPASDQPLRVIFTVTLSIEGIPMAMTFTLCVPLAAARTHAESWVCKARRATW